MAKQQVSCLGCKHCHFEEGYSGTEWLPGEDPSLSCRKNHFSVQLCGWDAEKDWMAALVAAVNCKDYEWNPEITKQIKEQEDKRKRRKAGYEKAAATRRRKSLMEGRALISKGDRVRLRRNVVATENGDNATATVRTIGDEGEIMLDRPIGGCSHWNIQDLQRHGKREEN